MTDPKLKRCPECGLSYYLHIFKYVSGWHNVECVMCDYLGPVEVSRRQAIKSYNEQVTSGDKDDDAENDVLPNEGNLT